MQYIDNGVVVKCIRDLVGSQILNESSLHTDFVEFTTKKQHVDNSVYGKDLSIDSSKMYLIFNKLYTKRMYDMCNYI